MCFENSIYCFFSILFHHEYFIPYFTFLDFCLQVDVVTPSGGVPVSVCTYKQSQDQDHGIVVVGSVERVSAFLTFSQDVG